MSGEPSTTNPRAARTSHSKTTAPRLRLRRPRPLQSIATRLFHLYQQRRVVNVNANIIAAGILSVALAKVPVYLTRLFLDDDQRLLITLIAGASDLFFDVVIFYGLHWIANHWRPLKQNPLVLPPNEATVIKIRRPFLKDATTVQIERLIFSPLYYSVAMGLMYTLLAANVEREWAFVISFITALIVTRIAHTAWGLRTGRFD